MRALFVSALRAEADYQSTACRISAVTKARMRAEAANRMMEVMEVMEATMEVVKTEAAMEAWMEGVESRTEVVKAEVMEVTEMVEARMKPEEAKTEAAVGFAVAGVIGARVARRVFRRAIPRGVAGTTVQPHRGEHCRAQKNAPGGRAEHPSNTPPAVRKRATLGGDVGCLFAIGKVRPAIGFDEAAAPGACEAKRKDRAAM